MTTRNAYGKNSRTDTIIDTTKPLSAHHSRLVESLESKQRNKARLDQSSDIVKIEES